jgi:hypothetical protein
MANEMTKKRNQKLVSRYNELFDVKRIRIDDVIKKLGDEFFLSKKTILNILSKVKIEKKNAAIKQKE